MMRSFLFQQGLLAAITAGAVLAAPEVKVAKEGHQVIFRSGEREVLRYQAEPGELPRPGIKDAYIRGGYIQALFTPAGKLLTDDFPPNHLHHHGIWTPWTKTEFKGRHPDFWNMGDGTGRVEFVSLGEVWQKDGKAGLEAKHRFMDLTVQPPETVLEETWKLTVQAQEGRNVIDLEVTQTCAQNEPLKLPEYHYGGFGFRGNRAWDGERNCRFLTASGKTDRKEVNTSREKWCWIGGAVEGATAGVIVLGHPDNFRFPQPVRAHPSEPFFCFAPQQAGAMEIVPGKPYTMKFRVLAVDGEPDAQAAEKAWQDYAGVKAPAEGK